MTKKQVFLFSLRLFFYFSALILIFIHHGITVSFDRIGIVQWFIIIPLEAFIAFFPFRLLKGTQLYTLPKRCIVALVFLLPLSIFAGGFGIGALQPFLAGLISFTLTFLLFHYPRWGKVSVFEPFFLTFICLRLLLLSRSGEEIAAQSMALTQFIFVWAAVVFLLHSAVVYFCLYPKGTKGTTKEGTILLFAAIAAFIIVLFVLPGDYINNSIVENLIPERKPEIMGEESEKGIPGGGGGRDRRRTLPQGEGGEPKLRGLSEHNWPSSGSRGGSRRGRRSDGSSDDNRQYMVKVVATDREPVYMGDTFKGNLDPVDGFQLSPQEPLNNLSGQRLFVTWFNNEPDFDIGRERQEIFSLSTLRQKYFPWRLVSVDPTILSENSGPLRYIHQVVSNTPEYDPRALVTVPVRRLSVLEKDMLAPYLEISLSESDMKIFNDFLNGVLKWWQEKRDEFFTEIFANEENESGEVFTPVNDNLEKIWAILLKFSKYQYNLNYDDNCTIAEIKNFLFETKEGDCVEFSNSLALLGRLAGIPSRVVTGYLVAESLQTQAHLQGLASLRRQIPVLQQFPFDNLFLVTNLHAHSWTQFYIPEYGWLDFEATSYAIPPVGTGNFNTWDVVIPIIDQNRVLANVRKFPWQALLRAIGVLAALALVCAYVLRYGREIVLYFNAQKPGREGARSLYLLLLARLAADGKPIKPASKTATEYAELFPEDLAQRRKNAEKDYSEDHFRSFALLYSQLRWREFENKKESDECFNDLKKEYKNIIITSRRSGIGWWLVRIISLRGLAYL